MVRNDSKSTKHTRTAVERAARDESASVEIEIVHVFPPDVSARPTNQVVIQYDKGEYRISFFYIRPPVTLGSPDERLEQLKNIGKIEARCVAELVISELRMPDLALGILENMQGNSPERFAGIADRVLQLLKGDEK